MHEMLRSIYTEKVKGQGDKAAHRSDKNCAIKTKNQMSTLRHFSGWSQSWNDSDTNWTATQLLVTTNVNTACWPPCGKKWA